jgi:hypothetical protein
MRRDGPGGRVACGAHLKCSAAQTRHCAGLLAALRCAPGLAWRLGSPPGPCPESEGRIGSQRRPGPQPPDPGLRSDHRRATMGALGQSLGHPFPPQAVLGQGGGTSGGPHQSGAGASKAWRTATGLSPSMARQSDADSPSLRLSGAVTGSPTTASSCLSCSGLPTTVLNLSPA